MPLSASAQLKLVAASPGPFIPPLMSVGASAWVVSSASLGSAGRDKWRAFDTIDGGGCGGGGGGHRGGGHNRQGWW